MASRIRRQPSLAQQAYTALVEDIASGALPSGERIRIEHLADHLGVSPTPVREAIACLVQEGIIHKSPDGKLQVVALTYPYVMDVFLVRSALEGLAAELAATHVTDTDLERLAEALERTTKDLERDDFDAYVATDVLLHGTTIASAGSATLSRELASLHAHVAYVRGYAQRHSGEHMRQSHREHLVVLAALVKRDPAIARHAMEQHIRRSGERIARIIECEGGTWDTTND